MKKSSQPSRGLLTLISVIAILTSIACAVCAVFIVNDIFLTDDNGEFIIPKMLKRLTAPDEVTVPDVTKDPESWTNPGIDPPEDIPDVTPGTGSGEDHSGSDGDPDGNPDNGSGDPSGGPAGVSGDLNGGGSGDGGDPSAPIFSFECDHSGRVYFRDRSLGNYVSGGFSENLPAAYTRNDSTIALFLSESALEDQYGQTAGIIRITPIRTLQHPLLPYFTRGDIPFSGTDCVLSGVVSESYTLYWIPEDPANLYDLSAPAAWDTYEMYYRAFVYGSYLEVPNAFRRYFFSDEIVSQIDTTDKAATIRSIASYIRNCATYNLEFEPAPAEEDPLMYFLTVSKEGICRHYASAATLMFRTYGIPARYTLGYCSTAVAGETCEVTGAEAHAWVEVYLDGIGWVPVEVTGGSGSGSGSGDDPGSDTRIPLVIMTGSATKTYDGTEIYTSFDDFAIIDGTLNDGDTIQVIAISQRTLAGTTANNMAFVVRNASGVNVTSEYRIFQAPGTLTVKPRVIRITTGSAESENGSLYCTDYQLTGGTSLAPGDSLKVEEKTVQDTPGQSDNVLTFSVRNADGEDVSDCYILQVTYGTLTVWSD